MLLDWLCKDDPRRFQLILKRHLEGYHLSKNPRETEVKKKNVCSVKISTKLMDFVSQYHKCVTPKKHADKMYALRKAFHP
jgi:hypothetical protein